MQHIIRTFTLTMHDPMMTTNVSDIYSYYTRPPSPMQRSMRRARLQRNVSSSRWLLCWGSTLLVITLLLYHLCWDTAGGGRKNGTVAYSWIDANDGSDTSTSAQAGGASSVHNLGKSFTLPEFSIPQKGFIHSEDPTSLHNQFVESRIANDVWTDDGKGGPDSNTVVNPELYGWMPNFYPNPLLSPLKCGISYLPNENLTSDLRLCDPDWVLGGIYLEEIAFAMTNFSGYFGDGGGGDAGPWDVGVGGPARARARSLDMNHKHALRQHSNRKEGREERLIPTVELAVATVRKMNVPAVLREGSYYAYEDEDDMVNDAAQIFSRRLHDAWWNGDTNHDDGSSDSRASYSGEYGILIFLSIQDRVCFISTGSEISSVLPWWRLDHIVASMKPDLRHREYGDALLRAIEDLSSMLEAGPPTMADRMNDFITRFGVVVAFALFTFLFGAWGEYRDRRKRWQYAEQRSKLSDVDREKARSLQRTYGTRACPICLETLEAAEEVMDFDSNVGEVLEEKESAQTGLVDESVPDLKRVDSFGIPLKGADGKKIKLLRCGHIYCETCWKSWVHSGYGNPCNCPVCRQDVGKNPQKRSPSRQATAAVAAVFSPEHADEDTDSDDSSHGTSATIPFIAQHPSYDSVAQNQNRSHTQSPVPPRSTTGSWFSVFGAYGAARDELHGHTTESAPLLGDGARSSESQSMPYQQPLPPGGAHRSETM
jgi:hypothetical protein